MGLWMEIHCDFKVVTEFASVYDVFSSEMAY